jgi:hypothetical protein
MLQYPSYLPITIQQGATFVLPVQFLDQNLNPLSLTGATAQFIVKSSPTDTNELVDISSPVDITINILQAVVTVNISAAATSLLPAPFNGVYNLLITSSIGVVARALEGPVLITPGVFT